MLNNKLQRNLLSLALLNGLLLSPVYAADWLTLQGTEPENTAPRIHTWGFIQAQYQKDMSDPNAAGGYIPPKLIGPNLTSQEQFNINRARLGARGTGFPLDGKVNYFLLAEFGNNGITASGSGAAQITDASITLNHIKGARIRAGMFKTPGAEETLQAIHVFDYINFTEVSNQLILERFPNKKYTANVDPVTLPAGYDLSGFDRPIGAARDVGIQVFDTFKQSDWEHSYAVMMGNGNGMNFGDNDNNKDTYLYWSSEKVFGGKGARRDGLKFFAWSQTGKRQLPTADTVTPAVTTIVTDDNNVQQTIEVTPASSTANPATEHDRKRSGVGVKYLNKGLRLSGEYMQGEGMIFVGPDKPTFDINTAAPAGNGEDGKANGYYLDVGYLIPGTKWELDARYDVYNRLTDDTPFPGGANIGKTFEMEFKTFTLGTQYHFNKKTRMTVNYANRSFTAVDFDSDKGPNQQLDGVDNRLALQLTHIF